MKNIMFTYVIMLFVFIFYSCESINNPQPVTESFLGQTPPGDTPIRFAKKIITDNFYPHSKLIISPVKDRMYWTTFLDTVSGNKSLYYYDFNGKNLSEPMKEISLDKYGILSLIFLNDNNNILFGSLQPYDKMEDRLVRAVWISTKTDSEWSKPQPIESTVDIIWWPYSKPHPTKTLGFLTIFGHKSVCIQNYNTNFSVFCNW